MSEELSWVDVVGYQHEVVHTGVLTRLLEGPSGASLAGALVDRDVAQVSNVRAEHVAEGGGGYADLVADLELADGSGRQLVVETKVHSNGTSWQLVNTARSPRSDCILLAVGTTGMKMGQMDTDYATTESKVSWRFVDASSWARLLDDVDGSPWLDDYLKTVRREAQRLEGERARARDGATPAGEGREPIETAHVAWLSEVRQQLWKAGASWWPITSMISGPVMPFFGPSDWEQGGTNVYLEFMGTWNGARQLCLKCGSAVPGTLLRVRDALLQGIDWEEFQEGKRPRANAKSCTVGVRDVSGDRPEHAAAIAAWAEKELSFSGPRALAWALSGE